MLAFTESEWKAAALARLAGMGYAVLRALVASTFEGQTLYRDAFRMLGVRSSGAFDELGRAPGGLG